MTDGVERALSAALEAVRGARLAVAFSGGRDSTVLLHALVRSGASAIRAWHVNHHIHEDSDAWQRHCEAVSASLGVECVVDHVDVRADRAVEEQARAARYRAWRGRLTDGEVLMLAHHLDDQVETVLWRLLRGSGVELLRGMPRQRKHGNGMILRPFLDTPRSALAEYASRHGLRWIEDPANVDPRHDRSYLRKEIVPRLAARFPHVRVGIDASAAALDRDAAIVERWLTNELRAGGATADTLPLDMLTAPRFTAHERVALLRHWLAERAVRGVPATRLHAVVVQSAACEARSPMVRITQDLSLRRYRGAWRLVAATHAFAPVRWSLGTPLELPHGTLEAERRDDGELDASLGEVIVRTRHAGDGLALAGRGTHRLKNLFQQAGIPPWERRVYPIIAVGDDVALVPGIGVAARHAANGPGWCIRWRPRSLV